MEGLILPSRAFFPTRKRSELVNPKRFRGYAKHLKCGEPAFWFTRFGRAWFEMNMSEIWFEDGQIKWSGKPVEEYRCPSCRVFLRGNDLRLIKIVHEDEAEAIHKAEHEKVPVGEICDLCGERRQATELKVQ